MALKERRLDDRFNMINKFLKRSSKTIKMSAIGISSIFFFTGSQPLYEGIYKDSHPTQDRKGSEMFIFQQSVWQQPPEERRGLDIYKDVEIQKIDTPEYQQAGIISGGWFNGTGGTVETIAELLLAGFILKAGYSAAKQRLSDAKALRTEEYSNVFFEKLDRNLREATVDNPHMQKAIKEAAEKNGMKIEDFKNNLLAKTYKNLLYSPAEWNALEEGVKKTVQVIDQGNKSILELPESAKRPAPSDKTSQLNKVIEGVEYKVKEEIKGIKAKFTGRGGFSLNQRVPYAFKRALLENGIGESAYTPAARKVSLDKIQEIRKFSREQKFLAMYGEEILNMAKGVGQGSVEFFKTIYFPVKWEAFDYENALAKNIDNPKYWEKIAKNPDVQKWLKDNHFVSRELSTTEILRRPDVRQQFFADPAMKEIAFKNSRTFMNKAKKPIIAGLITVAVVTGGIYGYDAITDGSGSDSEYYADLNTFGDVFTENTDAQKLLAKNPDVREIILDNEELKTLCNTDTKIQDLFLQSDFYKWLQKENKDGDLRIDALDDKPELIYDYADEYYGLHPELDPGNARLETMNNLIAGGEISGYVDSPAFRVDTKAPNFFKKKQITEDGVTKTVYDVNGVFKHSTDDNRIKFLAFEPAVAGLPHEKIAGLPAVSIKNGQICQGLAQDITVISPNGTPVNLEDGKFYKLSLLNVDFDALTYDITVEELDAQAKGTVNVLLDHKSAPISSEAAEEMFRQMSNEDKAKRTQYVANRNYLTPK